MMIMGNNRGITLIEVLVSIVIIGLVITALYNMNIAGFNFLAYNQDRVELQDQARLISSNLERQIRKANGIDIDSSDQNNLYLESGDRFYVENDIFKFTNASSGNTRNITSDVVSTHSFSYDDDSVIFEFNLKLDKSSYEIHNRFYPRAKN